MKKGLLLLGLGAVLCMTASAAPHRKNVGSNDKFELAKQRAYKINARNADNEDIWRAGVVTNYYWDGYENDWTKYNEFSNSYYPNGLLKEEVSKEGLRNFYEYDAEGRLISYTQFTSYDGSEESIESIETYEYDPIVKDLIVYVCNEYPQWGGSYGNGKEIIRNEFGNITSVKNYSVYDGEKEYSGDYLIIEYGDDNIATKITDYYIGIDYITEEEYIEENSVLEDIVWENTDGQIYDLNLNDPLSPAFLGANRINNCILKDLELPCEAILSVAYDGISYDATIELATGEKLSEFKYESLDEYGSYEFTQSSVEFDIEDGVFVPGVAQDEHYKYIVDKFGLILDELESATVYYEEGAESYSYEVKAEVTYDDTYGYPLEYIASSKDDYDDDFILQEKITYSEYINCNETVSVESVTNSANEDIEFYNLNGIRVSNPTKGIFIRRQGDKVSKVFVK